MFGTGGQDDEFINRASRTHSIESRFNIIYHALDRFVDAPLFGIGVGRFPTEYGNIIHNTPLWFATEMGTIGLLIFLGFIAFISLRLVTGYRAAVGDDKDVFLALGLCHGAMFTFSMGVEAFYQRHWWMVMALITAGKLLPPSSERPTDGHIDGDEVAQATRQPLSRYPSNGAESGQPPVSVGTLRPVVAEPPR